MIMKEPNFGRASTGGVRSLDAMTGPRPGVRPRAARVSAATATAGVLAIAGALLTGCSSDSGSTPQATAASYLTDWASRDWAGLRALVAAPPADFTAANAAAVTGLTVRHARYTAGRMHVTGSSAHEIVTQHLELAGIGPAVTITSVLHLVNSSGHWLVNWSPATIAPQLKPGDQLSLQVSWPARAQILGAGGAPLTTQAPMVTVGVEGERIKNAKSVSTTLIAAGAPKQAVTAAIEGAKKEPTWFEPVYTISWARYQQLKPTIYPIPGTVFETIHERAPATPGLGYIVGSVAPITAQQLQQLGAPYNASDVVGQTGLEAAYQRQLAGQPGVTVTATTAGGSPVATVATIPPRPGTAVQTSIDPRVQQDAETALAAMHKQAALIAVSASTGQVLAADTVPGTSGFNLALDGAFPPGSSFKIITSTALIEHGLTPSSPATCPQQLTVDGELFRNSEGTAPISNLLNAFAESCNTAFIGLATHNLTAAEFPATAAQYRIGTTPQLGLPAFGGSVPRPADEADLAATTIGQGRVLMSPLAMAMVAAGVDTGQVRAPVLVAGAPDDRVAPVSLPATVVSNLHTMMAQVVATGTASGKGLPAGTFAKTGTAQYGSGNPLPQDAWLVGFNGNVAFAMVTINGGEGGPTDGPIVARFLDLVRQSG
jgi:cell division protein FtsI/penicillin-binding protein 2